MHHYVLNAGNMSISPGLEEVLSPSAAPGTTSSEKLNNRSTMEKKVLRRVQVGLLEEVGSDRIRWAWCIL